ncbi:hypothetical protein [Frankia sp. QA3]|uniref:hypothetical protein n=1 Tax=Frankia sp. QA3 TaxID=710111 RepID=UPI00031EC1C4|nr:hypothetical protein [Frankia sp. QA3]
MPIAAIAFFGALPLIRESRAQGNAKYDLPGAALVTAGFVLLVYGLTEAATNGWSAARTIGLPIGGLVLLISFTLFELRVSHPLLPMRVAVDRNRSGAFRIGVHTSYASHVLSLEIIVAVGMAGVLVPTTSLALLGVGEDSGVASGPVSAAQQVNVPIGTALLNAIAATATASYLSSRHGATRALEQLGLAKGLVHGYSVASSSRPASSPGERSPAWC